MTDQEPIAAAILAALNAVTGVDAYDLDDVPGTMGNPGTIPARFVVIDLQRVPTSVYRTGGHNTPGYFLDTAYRADSVSNCRELRRLVGLALEAKVIGDHGFRFNDETQPIDDDADWGFSGVDTWSFT